MNQDQKPSKETLERWHKDPKNWKFGMFYYNKEDKRILPPKRIAWAGLTINFANPLSVTAFIAILIIIIGIELLQSK